MRPGRIRLGGVEELEPILGELGARRLGIAEDQLVVLDVLLPRVGEPVEPVGVERRRRGQRRRRDRAVGEQSRARERVRAAARDAPDGEPVDPQGVEDRAHVLRTIRDRAPGWGVDPPYPGRS